MTSFYVLIMQMNGLHIQLLNQLCYTLGHKIKVKYEAIPPEHLMQEADVYTSAIFFFIVGREVLLVKKLKRINRKGAKLPLFA